MDSEATRLIELRLYHRGTEITNARGETLLRALSQLAARPEIREIATTMEDIRILPYSVYLELEDE